MSAPVHIVGLAIEHRTSEDWLLRLPMRIGATDAATAAALVGAQCQLRLAGKLKTTQPAELLFNGSACRIEGHEIVVEQSSAFFADKTGAFKGELLVRLANGFDFVSHVFEVEVLPGLGWVA
jgi:hypothetical protein